MLTTTQIRDHLARRQYMPGWEFDVYDGRHEGQHLTIRATLPDAYAEPGNSRCSLCGPGYFYGDDGCRHTPHQQTVVVQVENMLPPMPDVDYLDAWMVWRLSRIASHEVREFYRDTDGRPVFDPHAEYAERDLP